MGISRVASAAELWDEIERLAPSHAGITRVVLDNPAARDGIVAPLAGSPVRIAARSGLAPFDPMATPGIDAVEAQGAPPRAGVAEPPGGDELLSTATRASGANGGAPGRPRSLRWPVPVEVPHLPAPDGYSLRLVSPRRLYDHGVLLEACRSLAPLAPPATVRVNPYELGRLGLANSARVRVRASRRALVFEAIADDAVPRGVASIDFNLHGDAGTDRDDGTDPGDGDGVDNRAPAGASALIDAREPVVDVRLETL